MLIYDEDGVVECKEIEPEDGESLVIQMVLAAPRLETKIILSEGNSPPIFDDHPDNCDRVLR